MSEATLLDVELQKRSTAIAYGISRRLAELYQGKMVLEASNDEFNVQQFAAAGHCTVAPKPGVHSQIETQWSGPGEGLIPHDCTAWYTVQWHDHVLEVVTASWREAHWRVRWQWIIAESPDIARQFLDEVCEWCHEVHGEVLVFSEGEWQKNADMFRSIAGTRFDSLVLQGSMKQELRGDFEHFLASRPMYEQYKVPWKRGALFLGPPGNGKTHCVKALVNALQLPCLYVQSFKACYGDEQAGVKAVFSRARKSAPCLLVLEDVDALVASEARAFLLNELDGFSENAGLITLATSNHPERLDPALVDRPSRFDRKYFFGPPGHLERTAYLSLWHEQFAQEMHVTPAEISELADLTDGFSFAYLKELVLSSLMTWMSNGKADGMSDILRRQAITLRDQMSDAQQCQDEAKTPCCA